MHARRLPRGEKCRGRAAANRNKSGYDVLQYRVIHLKRYRISAQRIEERDLRHGDAKCKAKPPAEDYAHRSKNCSLDYKNSSDPMLLHAKGLHDRDVMALFVCDGRDDVVCGKG